MKKTFLLILILTFSLKIVFGYSSDHYTPNTNSDNYPDMLFTTISAEAGTFLMELNSKNNEYYSAETVINPSEITAIIDKIANSASLTNEEKLFLKIEAYALWAKISVTSRTFKEAYPILKDFYKSVQDKTFRDGNSTSKVYASFADFAHEMIPLATLNKDIYVYHFTVDAEEFARMALIKDSANTKASVLYGIVTSMITKYASDQKYSKNSKFLKSTNGLPEHMVFRTHIYKSMLHMKVNEIEKAFEELKKAESIYPNAFFVSMLKTSYAEGRTGFTNSDWSNLDNFIIKHTSP